MREILVLKKQWHHVKNGRKACTNATQKKNPQNPNAGKNEHPKKKRKPYNRKLSNTLSDFAPKDVSHHRCKTPNTRQFRRQLSSKWPLLFIKWLILLVCYLLRVASIPIAFHIWLYLEIVVDSLIATRALLFCKKKMFDTLQNSCQSHLRISKQFHQ